MYITKTYQDDVLSHNTSQRSSLRSASSIETCELSTGQRSKPSPLTDNCVNPVTTAVIGSLV